MLELHADYFDNYILLVWFGLLLMRTVEDRLAQFRM